MIAGLLYAVGFLTRIPVPVSILADVQARRRSVAWYPLVGALLGGVLAGLAQLLAGHDALLAAALILLAWVGLTGALHLDGLADSADAWVGGLGDRERSLTIMKDPRCGPVAVVSVVLLLLGKCAGLQALAPSTQWLALVLSPLLGRAALSLLLVTTPYARPQGMASGLDVSRNRPLLAVLASLAAALACGVDGLIAVMAAGAVFWVWRRACVRRLGGYTGDTAGAMAELVELAVLLAIALHHA